MSNSDPNGPEALGPALKRIAEALERLSPPQRASVALESADAFVWTAEGDRLEAVPQVNRVDLELLKGVEQQKLILHDNTRRFALGLPANNALLWGARGMGKSSLVKAVHAQINNAASQNGHGTLALIEIHREDIPSLPRLLALLRSQGRRCILFCDDLS